MLACDGDGNVVVAEVDAVGVDCSGDIDSVVDDERDARIGRHVPNFTPGFVSLAGACVLLAELDNIDAPINCGLHHVERRPTVGEVRLRDEVGVYRGIH